MSRFRPAFSVTVQASANNAPPLVGTPERGLRGFAGGSVPGGAPPSPETGPESAGNGPRSEAMAARLVPEWRQVFDRLGAAQPWRAN